MFDLATSERILLLFLFVIGVVLGSFLNSWIWRTRENIRIVMGRSICIHCRRKLRWYENIPIFSYLALRGRCLTCRRPIPVSYPLVEFFTGAALVANGWYHINANNLDPWVFARDVIFTTILIIIFVFDYKYTIILSEIVWLGCIVGFIFNYYIFHVNPVSLLVGALVGGGFFLAQYVISQGRWIGGGDVRMGVMVGLWLGWPMVIFALFVAYVLGALVAVPLLLLRKKGMSSEIPFGTFLAMGTLAAMVAGNEIVRWYLEMVGY